MDENDYSIDYCLLNIDTLDDLFFLNLLVCEDSFFYVHGPQINLNEVLQSRHRKEYPIPAGRHEFVDVTWKK